MDALHPLKEQSAVVTGAASGIGRAVARAMAAAGARLTINYLDDPEAAMEVVAAIRKEGGEAVAVQADISREEQVERLFAEACGTFGTVDILVSNAGIQQDSSFVDMTLEAWNRVLAVNLTGAFLCARQAAREFCRRGVVPERSNAAGKIIFTSSVHEVIPWAGHANYAAAKGGLLMLMKSLAQELAPKKIRVNSIGPGAIKTGINRDAWKDSEGAAGLRELIPWDRIGEPEDVAPAAVWLASDAADYVTGTTLFVDGGMLLYPGFRTGG